jgi:hypothetical protein
MAVESVYPRANNTSRQPNQMRFIQHISKLEESSMEIDAALERIEREYIASSNRRIADLRNTLAEIRHLRAAIKNHTQSLREAA